MTHKGAFLPPDVILNGADPEPWAALRRGEANWAYSHRWLAQVTSTGVTRSVRTGLQTWAPSERRVAEVGPITHQLDLRDSSFIFHLKCLLKPDISARSNGSRARSPPEEACPRFCRGKRPASTSFKSYFLIWRGAIKKVWPLFYTHSCALAYWQTHAHAHAHALQWGQRRLWKSATRCLNQIPDTNGAAHACARLRACVHVWLVSKKVV